MDQIPICPEWWPEMLWKIHFPPQRPGPGPGPINYPPAIDSIMASLAIHSLSYMLLDKAAAQRLRDFTEQTLSNTANRLSKYHEDSVTTGPGADPRPTPHPEPHPDRLGTFHHESVTTGPGADPRPTPHPEPHPEPMSRFHEESVTTGPGADPRPTPHPEPPPERMSTITKNR
jgi:hypothetical protein